MKQIPCFDLQEQTKALKSDILQAVSRVCDQTAFSDGPFVEAFEKEFGEFLNAPAFAGVSSGSDALFLALRALGAQSGDQVIIPANTFIATAYAVQRLGATPVFADCDPVTWQIAPDSVRAQITEKTVGIIGVHLYGQMFPVKEILKIAREANLFLVEDCAQSQGSLYEGQVAGTFGNAGCFSFYPAKNLGALGEAGGIASADASLIHRVKRMRSQGSTVRYCHEELGYNMRMDGIQAAILSAKLKHLPAWNARRAEIVRTYRQRIQNDRITLQGQLAHTQPAWYLAVVCVDDRTRFLDFMAREGIHCGIHYPVPCHLQQAMVEYGCKEGDYPVAEWQAAHCVSLPLYPEMTREDMERVIDACNRYCG